jgi:hypothetical protein
VHRITTMEIFPCVMGFHSAIAKRKGLGRVMNVTMMLNYFLVEL